MKKILILLSLVSISVLVLLSCGKSSQKNQSSKSIAEEKLVVGMELEYPPFETIDAQGNPAGVSVVIARALGEYVGKEIEIQNISYPGLIPALTSGKIDLIISSMTINEERAKKVNFSDPYAASPLVLLVSKNSRVQSQKDLNNSDITIATKTGTIGGLWAGKNAPLADIKSFDKESVAVLDVAQGNSDVFIYDPLAIVRHHENYPDTTRIILEPLENAGGWGIAVSKNDPKLLEQVNEFISLAQNDGTFAEIRNIYLKEKAVEFEKKTGMKFFF